MEQVKIKGRLLFKEEETVTDNNGNVVKDKITNQPRKKYAIYVNQDHDKKTNIKIKVAESTFKAAKENTDIDMLININDYVIKNQQTNQITGAGHWFSEVITDVPF